MLLSDAPVSCSHRYSNDNNEQTLTTDRTPVSGLRCLPQHTPPPNKADTYALFSFAEIRETLNNLILKVST